MFGVWKKCNEHCSSHDCIEIPNDIRKIIETGSVDENHAFGQFLKTREQKQSMYEDVEFHQERQQNMTLFELLDSIILKKDMDIRELLDGMSENKSLRGNLYQSMWIVMLLLDRVIEFDSSHYDFLFGRIENENFLSDLNQGIVERKKLLTDMKVNMGNKVGVADISLLSKFQKTTDESMGKWACEIDDYSKEKTKKNSHHHLVLISSKYYIHEKTVSNYDIENIVHAMEVHKRNKLNFDYDVVLFVRDKVSLEKKLAKTTKLHYLEDIKNRIYDVEDLNQHVMLLRAMFPDKDAQTVVKACLGENVKPRLLPKFHQLLFVNRTMSCMKWDNQKLFLWGQIARSGKTYTSGCLISKLYNDGFFKNKKPGIVLVITPAPTETIGQFVEELFLKFADFDGFDVLKYDGRTKTSIKEIVSKATKPVIVVASKQFLQGGESGKKGETLHEYELRVKTSIKEKLSVFEDVSKESKVSKNLVDLLIFDEIHYGGTTQISQWILKTIDPKYKEGENEGDVVKVFLTATYKKPVDIFKLKENQLLTWGLDDIEMCKYIGNAEARGEFISSCIKKYGSDGERIFDESLKELQEMYLYDNDEEMYDMIEKEYRKFPTLHVMTSLFDSESLSKTLKNNINGYNFDFNSIFATEKVKTATNVKANRFVNELSVKHLMEYIADMGNEKCIIRRIRRTFIQHDQSERNFFSQLWFLPYYVGNRIADVASTLKNMLESSSLKKWFNKYNIYVADDKSDKQSVKVEELKAKREGKKGLIILVGKKFSLGVSLPCVDVVMFLNNDHNVDDLYQRMFRALTESKKKKLGVLVDLNPYRSITTLLEYTTQTRQIGQLKKKEDLLENVKDATTRKIWLLDSDLLYVSDKHKKTYNELYTVIKEVIDLNFLTEQLEKTKNESENIFKFMLDTHEQVLQDFLNIKQKKNGNKMGILEIGKKPPGQPKKEEEGDGNGKPKNKKAKKERNAEEIDIEEKKKLLARVFGDLCVLYALLLPSSCINFSFQRLCIELTKIAPCQQSQTSPSSPRDKYGLTDLWQTTVDKFSAIIEQNDTKDSNENTNTNTTKINKVDKVCLKTYRLMKKYFADENILSSDINRQFDQMKKHVVDIDEKDMDKIHAFVEKYLTPKEYEKKAFGEVFTPLKLVREMLDAVETYADKDFWKNPDLKILDPAAGIGNFPLIAFEKLMQGLKSKIPKETKRKRHILEKMLYMVELNPNNVRLMKKIFGGKNYSLNIIEGDFLHQQTLEKIENVFIVGSCPHTTILRIIRR